MKLFIIDAVTAFPSCMSERRWEDGIKEELGDNYSKTPQTGCFSIVEDGVPQCSDRYVVYVTDKEEINENEAEQFLSLIRDITKKEKEMLEKGMSTTDELIESSDVIIGDETFFDGKRLL